MNSGFIGRAPILSSLEDYFNDGQLPNRIALISGIPGVGKTCLLEHLGNILSERNIPFALTTAEIYSAVQIMDQLAISFEQNEKKLKKFRKKYAKYLETIAKVEKSIDMRELGGSFLGKLAGKSIVYAGSLIPAGNIAVNMLGADFIEDQTDALFNFLFSKLRVKEEVMLLLNPLSALSPLFIEDLNSISKSKNLIFALDNFNSTDSSLLSWITDISRGKYGNFNSNVIFILSAQKFDRSQLIKTNIHLKEFAVEPFSLEETAQFVLSHGITDPVLLHNLYERSGGLPLFLSIFISFGNLSVDEVSQTVADEILKSVDNPKWKAVLLRLSTTLSFNKDILAVLVKNPDDLPAIFDWVIKLPFVNFSNGDWRFQPAIRRQLLSLLRQQSPKEYQTSNSDLFRHFQNRLLANPTYRNTPWMNYKEWWQDYLYGTYHLLGSDPVAGKTIIYQEFPVRFFNSIFELDRLREWAAIMSRAVQDAGLEDEFSEFAKAVQEEFQEQNFFNRAGEYTPKIKFIFETVYKHCDNQVPAILRAWMRVSQDLFLIHNDDLYPLLDALTEAIEIDPSEGQFLTIRSLVRIKIKDDVGALADLSSAIQIGPTNKDNYYLHGLLSYQADDDQTALSDFTHIIQSEASPLALYYRARIHEHLGLYNDVVHDATSALEYLREDEESIASNSTDRHFPQQNIENILRHSLSLRTELLIVRGEGYYHLNEYQKADMDFMDVLQSQTDHAISLYFRGMIAFSVMKYPEASQFLERSLQSDLDQEKQISAHLVRGICLYEGKQIPAALEELRIAINLNPNHPEVRNTRATILNEIGEHELAVKDCNHLLASDSKDCQALLTRAKSLIALQQYKQGLDDLNLIVNLVQNKLVVFELDTVYLERGRAFFNLQDYTSAVLDFQRVVEINPSHAGAYFRLGMARLNAKDFKAAIECFNKAEQNQFGNPELFFMRGTAFELSGQSNNAILEYSKAINENPSNPMVFFRRASLFILSGDWEAALGDLNRTLELDPNYFEALSLRGVYFFNTNNYGVALHDLEKAASQDRVNETLLNTLGKCYLRLELYEQALGTFKKATQYFPNNAAGYRGRLQFT